MAVDATGLRDGVIRWVGAIAEAWSDDLVEALREDAPVAEPTGDPRQRPPGTLARAIHREPVSGGGDRYTFTVVAPGIEARTTAKGAAPHVIRPRTSGVLMFYSGGEPQFRGEVNHPGNVGTEWFQRGIESRGQATLLGAAARVIFR